MKRLIPLLLVLLALCGCAAQPEPTVPPTVPPVTEPATEPVGIYEAESELEIATNGAVQIYPLGQTDSVGIAHMGDDLLIFSGTEATKLTRYSGDDLYISAAAVLNCSIYPSDPAVQVSEKGITYYDERQNDLIFLDANFEEVKHVSLPDNICGAPALSADRLKLYYCTTDALRCLDLETGLDRLLKEMYFSRQTLTALHCDDTVIVCDTEDTDGNQSQLYISAETGQLLNETLSDVDVWTQGSFYLAVHQDGVYEELLVGDSEQGPTLLAPHTYGSAVFSLVEIGGTVLVSEDAEAGTLQLDYYDLQSGKRTGTLTLNGLEPVYSFHADTQQAIWFLRYDPVYGCEVLHRWDLTQTTVDNEASCFSARYTAENPDYVGIAACRQLADDLSNRYGVQILLWTDATAFQPWDYTLVPEYQVPVILDELKALEVFLSLYPEGFLQRAAERTTCGRIQICLVRSILGNETAEGTLREAVGLQYWDDNTNAYLSLAVGQDRLVQNACHEIFHILESRVLTVCRAYDDWNKLNPKGFEYDYDYTANLSRDDSPWTESEGRAFIDTYSMSFPKEDRARIMEYAMMPGNEACFQSEIMQKKLRQLCLGIREAFDLEKSEESFLWEQYLEEPLNKR